MNESPESKNTPVTLVVSGDVTTDFKMVLPQEHEKNEDDKYLHILEEDGGVFKLTDLVRKTVVKWNEAKSPKIVISDEEAKKIVVCPQDPSRGMPQRHHSFYTTWKEFPKEIDHPIRSKEFAWRVENVLGLRSGNYHPVPIPVVDDNENAEIVLLDDRNLGFSNGTPEYWTRTLLNKTKPPWVVLKTRLPDLKNSFSKTPLGKILRDYHHSKLITILTIDDLCQADVQISREISWELTAQDLMREVIVNPSLNAFLSHCALLIVLFGTDGAILVSQPSSAAQAQSAYTIPEGWLVFDPKVIDGEWKRNYPGEMVGYKTCMAASIALSLMEYESTKAVETRELLPDKIVGGIKRGLCAIRNLHMEGYRAGKNRLTFPTDEIAEILTTFLEEKSPFVDCKIRRPTPDSVAKALKEAGLSQEFWTILSEKYNQSLEDLSTRVARWGVEKQLKDAPRLEFGGLITVDRREIESYRSIRSLIVEYVKAGINKPLSIAVFGPPGSGKSFGITEMAKSMLEGRIADLTFNLSQFSSADELRPALYQVRDIGLTGKIPLIFWDEFDTALEGKPFGWLRYFLAPMQDGKFQDGQITHPIGQAIFVFAGGTATTIKEFEENGYDKKLPKDTKLIDFLSRLRGYVNILGPNPVEIRNVQGSNDDDFYVIRRAILLRSMLSKHCPYFFELEKLRIDEGVLQALLTTKSYKHGARSMESLIAMSLTDGRATFGRSSLPPKAQLDLHVDAEDFMALVSKVWFTEDKLETIAPEVHQEYGRIYNFETRPYECLSEHEKDLNRSFVRDIAKKLQECNCRVVAKRDRSSGFAFTSEEVEHLAKMEHERWLAEKIKAGFRYASAEEVKKAKELDPHVLLNSSMLLWDGEKHRDLPDRKKAAIGEGSLPEPTKELNRQLIRSIPHILESQSFTIVRKKEDFE